MERLAELNKRAMENLDRIAVGVLELQHFEHATLFSFLGSADAELDSRLSQLPLHLRELVCARDAEAEIA